jgi:hypothetical protein
VAELGSGFWVAGAGRPPVTGLGFGRVAWTAMVWSGLAFPGVAPGFVAGGVASAGGGAGAGAGGGTLRSWPNAQSVIEMTANAELPSSIPLRRRTAPPMTKPTGNAFAVQAAPIDRCGPFPVGVAINVTVKLHVGRNARQAGMLNPAFNPDHGLGSASAVLLLMRASSRTGAVCCQYKIIILTRDGR